MKTYVVTPTSDKKLLESLFKTDPALYAYQLGDLDPFFFSNTRWWSIALPYNSIEAATLLYTAFDTPVIQALSDNHAQGELWQRLLTDLPPYAHTHYRTQHKSIIEVRYEIQEIGTHYKMRWHGGGHQSRDIDLTRVVTLSPDDRDQINALYRRAYPESYFDTRLLETGYCVGIFADESAADKVSPDKKLVSVATCHVFSRVHSVASLGSITTDHEYRGQGLGSAVTLALVKKLSADIDCICLNVHSDNAVAIRIYERIGFVRCHDYEEGMLSARGAGGA